MTVTYRAIRAWAAFLVRTWYRTEWRGAAFPADAPCIMVVNHTNGLCDGHVLLAATPRQVHVLAKFKLFDIPVLGWIVRNVGAIPVYRKKDGVDTSRNADTFRAIHDTLAKGKVIAVFPEGESRAVPYLREMKSGAARMALGAEDAADWKLGVMIVPVGITYEDHGRFRSRAEAWIGEPIPVAEFEERWEESPVRTYRLLSTRMADALRDLILDVPPAADHGARAGAVAAAVERVLPPGDGALGARRQAAHDGLAQLAERDAEGHERRVEAALALDDNLRAHGLTAADIFDDDPKPALALILELWLRALVGVSLGLLVALVWWWPLPLARFLGRRGASTPDKVTTVTLLVGFVIQLVWAPLLASLCIALAPSGAWPLVLVLVALGAFGLPAFRDNLDALRHALGRLRLRGASGRRDALRESMRTLAAALGA